MAVEFTQKWVENAVKKLLGKDAVEPSDLARVKYLAIGETFDNDFYIAVSAQQPPKPFVDTANGGDEWSYCLRGADISKLVEKFKGKVSVQLSDFRLVSKDEQWEKYCCSEEADALWKKFAESIVEEHYFVEFDNDDDYIKWYNGVRVSLWSDLALFTGVEVLRVQGLEIPDLTFLEKFSDLRTAEFVETVFNSTEGIERLNSLEQASCWLD